jgi:hypothetical protein
MLVGPRYLSSGCLAQRSDMLHASADFIPQPGSYVFNSGSTIAVACFALGTSSIDATTKLRVSSEPTTSTTSQTSATNDRATSSPSPNPNAPSKKDGLSTTAMIATVVGTIVGFLSLLVAVIGLKKRHDRSTWDQTVTNTATMISCCNWGGGGNQSQRNDRNQQRQTPQVQGNYQYTRYPSEYGYSQQYQMGSMGYHGAENMLEEVYEFVLYLVIILPFWDSYEKSFRCSSTAIFSGGAFRCSTTRDGLHQPCHPGLLLSIKPKNRLSAGIVYSAPNAIYQDQRDRRVLTISVARQCPPPCWPVPSCVCRHET